MGFLGGLIRAGVAGAGGALKGANAAEQTNYERDRQRQQDALQTMLLNTQIENIANDNQRADAQLEQTARARQLEEVMAKRRAMLDAQAVGRQDAPPITVPEWQKQGYPDFATWRRDQQMGKIDPNQKPGGAGGAPVKTTADERKGAGFLLRAKKAEQELSGVDGKTYMPTEKWSDPAMRLLTPKSLEGFTTSEASRNREPSEKAFLSAVLRKDTGAVISDIEYDDGVRQYFERATDSPQQKATKRSNRLNAIKELELYGGRAVNPNAAPDESTVTPAERAALKAQGYSDAEIDAL